MVGCPPSKSFTPLLVDAYNDLTANGTKWEVLFASSDRSLQQFEQ